MVAVEYDIVEGKAGALPNPDLPRKQCVIECTGCNKMFSSMQMKVDENGEIGDVIGDVCIAYLNPKEKQRRGCGLQSNIVIAEEKKK